MIKLSINCRSFGRLAAGVSYLCLAVAGFAQSGTWTNLAGGSWAAATNWSGGVIATNSGSKADFSTLTLTSPLTVTLDGARTIGGLTFGDAGNAFGSTLSTGSGGPLTLTPASGLPLITVNNQTSTISAVLTGSAGLSKAGPGALVLSGANTFTGPLAITNGVVTFTGNGASTGAGSYCYVGGPTGRAVLNQNSGGTLNLGTGSSGYVLYVGGTGGSGDTGLGAVNQTAGTVNTCSSSVAGAYLTLGSASATAYGSYVLSGGTLNVAGANGIRLGFGGMGSYLQSGGNLTLGRYFSLAGNSANAKAVATFTGGGVFISSGYRILVPDAGGATGTFNIGTEAGGTALITNLTTTGLMVGNGSSGNGTFNLNSGTLQIAGPIYRNSNAGAGVAVNFNGGTLQAGSSTVTLLAASVTNATVYNGGLVLDSQANTATFLGTLLGAAGNGVYPAGGTFAMASGGGSGYLGAPLVTVTNTGSGYGVKAIANIANGAVTGVTLTCPGQNYSAGDVLGFVFSGGGAITPATSYLYTLTAGDLSSNVLGGLTKNGSGILNLTVANTYTGNTTINAGTLNVTMDGGLGYGRVVVANGATLALSGGVTNGYIASSANLVVGASAAASLNFTGTNTVNGLSLDGGASFAAPGYYGSSSSVAPNQVSQFSGAGVIYVTAQPLASTVALVSSLNPAEVSQTVTLTATVSGSSGTPAGTVTFKDGAGILGTVALNGSGQATLVTSALAVGTHAVTAIYSGNSSYSSGSSSLAQVINPHLDIWSGAVNHTWDIATTSNWLDLGSQVAYRDGDQAQFDDTATGSTNISLGAAVSPAAVVFTNNSKSYNLGGAGVIGGAGGLSLLGTGSLTISNANAYAGATAVQGGTLNFSGASAYSGNGTLNVGNGNGTGVVNFASSGTFSFSGSASTSLGGVAGDSTDAGSGVINQSNGTVNLGSGFLELGAGDSGN
ncbi:MAG: Ig-like domain repeat protein, partial [Verrucomicrobiae bacterium]|nr:Ig-like domain repeat protein [Verrucomicrobiae bacterium]